MIGIINKLKKTIKILRKIFSKKTVITIKNLVTRMFSFLILLSTYISMVAITKFTTWKYCPAALTSKILPIATRIYFKIVSASSKEQNTINRINLIELAIKNMRYKMTRTLITIGGMAVGIATIVFLVSIGYGLQNLVVSRVARLDELKQADVSLQPGSNSHINDETISNFQNLSEVQHALPLIAIVGKVNYKNSISDMAVYGATSEYLKQSAIQPVKGKLFESDALSKNINKLDLSNVAGAKTKADKTPEYGKEFGNVEYEIYPQEWITVREGPETDAEIIGYTKRAEGQQTGREMWGGAYNNLDNGKVAKSKEGKWMGKWIYGKVYLWEQDERQYKKINDDFGRHKQIEGYIAEVVMTVKSINIIEPAAVLGLQTGQVAAETTETTSAGIVQLEDGWVLIEDESVITQKENIQEVKLASNAIQQAVVNRAMLKVLGIEEKDSIGEKFEVSFIVTNDLLESTADKIQAVPEEYEIIGVIPPDDTPQFYVPFIDLRGLGIVNYSQVKIVTSDPKKLDTARKKIEAMGFVTTSVADTVSQIDVLFETVRKVLAVIGAVALIVASLGMFNTLTVSLLERTREIGLMKAMGMRSVEVQELFLTESMVMGFFGGVLGIFLGWAAGKILGLILSVIALVNGLGFINISYIPPSFVALIAALSLIVGLLTGIYPARRATKISALNALRYE